MRAKKAIQNQEKKRGAALMTLMIVILLVAGTSAYMVSDAKQQAFAVTRVRDYLKAQAYAEGGANQAYSLLKTNFALRTNPANFPLTTYGDGTYDVTVTPAPDGTNASISCIGQRGRATVNVVVDIHNFGAGVGAVPPPPGVPPAVGAYTYAIVSGGPQGWSGSGNINVGSGKLHGNGQFKMTGSKKVTGNISSSVKIWLTGSTKITGDAAAPVINASAGAITGTKTVGPVPNVVIPDIDLTPYYNAALANGQVYSGNQHFSGSTDLAPNGGIMWVNGNLKYSGSGKMIGSFIATGDFDYSGSGDQTKVANYPAFVSRDGDVDISGSGKSQGLIYSKTGGFDKSGSGDHTGSIIVNGDFDASGSWSALIYENSTPVPPGDGSGSSGTTGDRVGVIAWQK